MNATIDQPSPTVVVVEADDLRGRFSPDQLTRDGFTVHAIADPRHALALCAAKLPDAAIVDVNGGSGRTFAVTVRRATAKGVDAPAAAHPARQRARRTGHRPRVRRRRRRLPRQAAEPPRAARAPAGAARTRGDAFAPLARRRDRRAAHRSRATARELRRPRRRARQQGVHAAAHAPRHRCRSARRSPGCAAWRATARRGSTRAHVVPRSLGGCDDALCVVALCRDCHRRYDRGALDLVPSWSPTCGPRPRTPSGISVSPGRCAG